MTTYNVGLTTRFTIGVVGAMAATYLAYGFVTRGKPSFAAVIAFTGLMMVLAAITGGEP